MERASSMDSSAPGILVTWKDVGVSVKGKGKGSTVALLEGVSAYALPGEVLAIMGPSGSGKSTLLDTLAGRKTVGRIVGTIRYGGVEPTTQFIRRYCGYVVQGDDTLLSLLTCEEMLRYTAELKLERHVGAAEKKKAVEDVLRMLGLATCRHVLIGDRVSRGISGGQAKRVSIGIALIGISSAQRVLCLDEPTSGLDSFTANEIISVVKSLADSGITVITTVHSPSPYAFGQLDKLLLLGASGRQIFFGETSHAAAAIGTACESFLGEWDVHASTDSEFLIDVVTSACRLGHEQELVDMYDASGLRAKNMEELEHQLRSTSDLPEHVKMMMVVKKATTTPTWWALAVLFRYRTLKSMVTAQFYGQHVFPWLIQTVIIGSVFWAVASLVTPGVVTNISAIIFFWVCTTAFGAASYVPAVILAKPIMAREVQDGLYRPFAYLVSLLIEEVIIAVPTTLVINAAMWFALQMSGSFVSWWVTFFIAYVTGILVSYAICAFSPAGIAGLNIANAAVPIYGVICLFFSGFLISLNSIGWWWRWLVYVCPTFWGFAAQMNNYFQAGTDRDIPYLGSKSVPAHFGLDVLGTSPWPYTAMMCVFPVAFFLVALVGFNGHQVRR